MQKWRWQLTGITIMLIVALYGATHVFAVWWHLPVLLSATDDVCDMEPRSSISADGAWLANVWIKGRKDNNSCVSRGPAVLRWTTTDPAQQGWSSPRTLILPAPYTNDCFVHTDVALHGSAAHIAATVWSPCEAASANSAVLYYTCDLSTGVCAPATVAIAQAGSSNLRLSDVRIVLDSQNRPHIVYGRGDHTLAQGQLFYTRRLDGVWTANPLQLSPAAESAYRPALAASNGHIHITWQRHTDYPDGLGRLRQRGDVRYRYCAETGSCNPIINYPSPTSLSETTYPVPNVAARGNRVILTWNVCADMDGHPPCESFYLVYARSDTNGAEFSTHPLEVGTEIEMHSIYIPTRPYAGTDDTNSPSGEYGTHLNSTLALDPAGLPYLVWQVKQGDGYVLTTTHAISATSNNFTWAQEALPQFGDGSDNRVYPSLTMAASGDTQALHLTYMRAWRENQWSRSQVFYDVISPERPIVQLNYTERTSALPLERAQVITAHVTQQNGAPFNNIPVHVKTTRGSFTPNGYGVSQLQTTTGADGRATVTLYSNQVGTAQVSAWIDSIANLSWDAGEPGAVLTQTWVFNGTPSVNVSSQPVEGGQWITATVRDHPYADSSDPDSIGEPLDYFMWWCPTDAPEYPPAQQLGQAFQVDVETWERANMMVRVPLGSMGVYHIETHFGIEGGIPCGHTHSLIAASATLTATSALPSLTASSGPLLSAQWMTATVHNHPYYDINGAPIYYALWWCPVTASPPTQQIGAPFLVNANTWSRVNWTFRAPSGLNGTYRLETHTAYGDAPCDAPDSRVAVSAPFAATSDYPPTPLITLSNDQPYPGAVIAATLRRHPSNVYDVWWCTAYGKPIAERLVAALTVDTDATPTSLRVPLQVAGLYHLESHSPDPDAACGNATTQVGSSPLIWPYSNIYLPLVMRGY